MENATDRNDTTLGRITSDSLLNNAQTLTWISETIAQELFENELHLETEFEATDNTSETVLNDWIENVTSGEYQKYYEQQYQ